MVGRTPCPQGFAYRSRGSPRSAVRTIRELQAGAGRGASRSMMQSALCHQYPLARPWKAGGIEAAAPFTRQRQIYAESTGSEFAARTVRSIGSAAVGQTAAYRRSSSCTSGRPMKVLKSPNAGSPSSEGTLAENPDSLDIVAPELCDVSVWGGVNRCLHRSSAGEP
jgi:hypothetical protein